MKKTITGIVAAVALASTAQAVEATEVKGEVVVLAAYLADQATEQTTATDFIGQPVHNAAGETIGEVKDLVLSADGMHVATVVGVGGFLGIGEKDVALSPDAIMAVAQDDGTVRLSTLETEESLKAAPAFKPVTETRAERKTESEAALPVTAAAE